jgi:hypothetical protein
MIETFITLVGFEPTVPAFELVKTAQALECAATVIVDVFYLDFKNIYLFSIKMEMGNGM